MLTSHLESPTALSILKAFLLAKRCKPCNMGFGESGHLHRGIGFTSHGEGELSNAELILSMSSGINPLRTPNQMPVTSDKFREAEATLPEDLKPIFHRLVEEYEYITSMYYGRGYVAYKVLADLVLAGWRPSDPPRPGSPL